MNLKSAIKKTPLYSLYQIFLFFQFLLSKFVLGSIRDPNFTYHFVLFLYYESYKTENKRILNESFIRDFPIGPFSDFKAFLHNCIERNKRFVDNNQQPTLFYSSFLKAKSWYHASESSDKVDYEVEKIKNKLRDNILLFEKSYEKVSHISFEDTRNKGLAKGTWDVFPLYSGTGKITKNCNKCPEVLDFINKLPRFSYGLAYFSIMQPKTYVEGHHGPTNTRLRYHLGLDIPDDVYFRVSENINKWIQGDCITFDDSFYHEVYQQSERKRVVFILDCWHPELTISERIFITKFMRLAISLSNQPVATRKVYK